MGELKARPNCARLGHTILIGLAELTIGEIAQHDGVSGALELLLYFGGSQRCVLAQGLAEFLTHFRIAGDDLHVEPEEVAHLVEGGFEDLNRFHLRWIGESFHELGVGGGRMAAQLSSRWITRRSSVMRKMRRRISSMLSRFSRSMGS